MMREGLTYFSDTQIVMAGFIFFFIFFLSTIAWCFRPSANELYDKCSKFPLEEGELYE
jgi:cbb3-type cytochrome oxidase subunit 3